eukprot:4769057-Pleurochrysis_carterae.AAC.2
MMFLKSHCVPATHLLYALCIPLGLFGKRQIERRKCSTNTTQDNCHLPNHAYILKPEFVDPASIKRCQHFLPCSLSSNREKVANGSRVSKQA